MDKNTFGSTPAAMYLADRLNQLNCSRFSRKVSKRIDDVNAIISETVESDLTPRTMIFVSEALAARALKAKVTLQIGSDTDEYDELAANLMINVMMGSIKSLNKRASVSRISEKKNSSLHDDKLVPSFRQLKNIQDPTNSTILWTRSRKRLERKGKL